MAISSGASSQVGFVTETTWGTTPATPALVALPFTDFSLALTKDEYEDSSINADRMERYLIDGNRHVAGDIGVNFAAQSFDMLLESLLANIFTANTLKVGNIRKSFTIEEAHKDINVYQAFTGIIVDKLDLTVPSNGIVTAKFSVIGKDAVAPSATSIDTDGYGVPVVATPMTHINGTFNEGGTATGVITSISLNVDNGYTANYSLGNAAARDLTYNFVKVTGTVSAYFESAALLAKFFNGASSSIDFTLTDGVHTMKFNMPNVKFTGASKNIGSNGPIMISLPFKALYDSVSGSNIIITRT